MSLNNWHRDTEHIDLLWQVVSFVIFGLSKSGDTLLSLLGFSFRNRKREFVRTGSISDRNRSSEDTRCLILDVTFVSYTLFLNFPLKLLSEIHECVLTVFKSLSSLYLHGNSVKNMA